MPWEIREVDNEYCVYKEGEDTPLKCYADRAEADDYMKALYASEDKGGKMFWQFTQEETAYTPLSATAGQACAACRFFKTAGDEYSPQDACVLVTSFPNSIEPTGWCNQFQALPEYKPEPMPVVIVDTPAESGTEGEGSAERKEGGAWQSIMSAFRPLLRRKEQPAAASGFKVLDDGRWAGWYTNNLRDRENEFFPAKAIDEYIERVDAGIVPMPELWSWHIKGSRHGQAEWVARLGHYVVAVGKFDDTPAGQGAKAHYSRAKNRPYAMSHGFTYDVNQYKDGVYHQFNTFEISVLPPQAAANPYTRFEEVKAMELSPEKKVWLEATLGKSVAAGIIADTEAANKAVEEAGVAYKDFVSMSDTPSPAPEAVKQVSDNLNALLGDTMRDSAAAVKASAGMSKELKAMQDAFEKRIKAMETDVAAMKAQLDLRPRSASRATETEVNTAELSEAQKRALKEAFEEYEDNPVFGKVRKQA